MICIIGSETTKNYGLFHDLSHSPEFKIVYAQPLFLWWPFVRKLIRRIRSQWFHKKELHMAWEGSILKNIDRFERIIVVDTALRNLSLSFLNDCKNANPDLQIDCLLLNSSKSWTFSDPRIKNSFYSFNWSCVLSFDKEDCKKENWVYTGLHYYSKRNMFPIVHTTSDIYFAGSLKGERGGKLLHLLEKFNEHNVKCCFLCPNIGIAEDFSRHDGLYLLRKRISYKRTLRILMKSNCILEVLQSGQGGSTLRYFEAVCYNKKLLTTNPEIKNYPFYDERFMKVFSQDTDIDFEWIKRTEHIDYGYHDEFSPIHLFDTLK